MSLDKSAMQHIEDNTAARAFNAANSGLTLPFIALPSNVETKDIEHLLPHPIHFKGHFNTLDINEFIDYVTDQGEASVFVSPDSMAANAIFNLGDPDQPEHRFHQSNVKLEPTDEFNALMQIHNSGLSVKSFIEWLEEWHPHLEAYKKEAKIGVKCESIDLNHALVAIRNITTKVKAEVTNKIEDFSESNSAFASIDIDNEKGQLPAYIDFTCVPFEGLKLPMQADNQNDDENEQRTFRMRFAIIAGDNPTLMLKIMRLDQHKKAMLNAFKDQLKNNLNPDYFTVRIGNFK